MKNRKKSNQIQHNALIKKDVMQGKKEVIFFLVSLGLSIIIFLKYYLLHQQEYKQFACIGFPLIGLTCAAILIKKALFLTTKTYLIIITSGIVVFIVLSLLISAGFDFSHLIPLASSISFLCLGYIFILLIAFLSGKKVLSLLGCSGKTFTTSPLREEGANGSTGLDLLFSLGLGFGFLMLIVFGIGLLGGLYQQIIWLIMIILLIVFLLISRREIKETFQSICQRMLLLEAIEVFPLFLLTLFMVIMGSCFVDAILPPTSWDSLAYHLKIPSEYIASHRIIPLIYNFNANTSHNMEILYTLAMLIKGQDLAQLLNLTTFILSLLGVYVLCRKFASILISLLGTGIFLANGLAINTITTADVDMGLCLFFLLSILAFIRYKEDRSLRWVVLMGFYTGIALGIKYIGGFCLIALFLCLLGHTLIGKSHKTSPLVYLGVSLLFFSPWLIKNYYFVANPVYPELFSIFGGTNWSQIQAEQLSHFHHSIGMGRNILDFLLLPWNITMNAGLDYKYFLGKVTPLLLMFLPAFLLLNKEKILWYLLMCSGIYFILWAYSFQNLRYLVPIFPLLSVLCSYALNRMKQIEEGFNPTKALFYVVGFLIIIVMAKEGTEYIKKVPQGLTLLIKKEVMEDYLSKTIQPYDMSRYINKNLPCNSKVLFMWENRGFYCQREYISDLIYEAPWTIPFIRKADNPDKLLSQLKSLGITHILYNQALGNVFRPSFTNEQQKQDFISSLQVLEQFLMKYTRQIHQSNEILLFEIHV